MTQSALLERLRPGRDSNDASWVIVRYARDWRAAQSTGVTFDAARGELELAPVAIPDLASTWLPNAPVQGPDGTFYHVDTENSLLLAKRVCEEVPSPIAGLGGRGFATGRLDTPTGLAVDGQGWLYVADAGNRRVQVIDPAAGVVVAVLADSMSRPVHVALAKSGEIFVLDAGQCRVHVFGPRFEARRSMPLATRDSWTGEEWVPPPEPEPRAITVLADGSLAVFDPMRPMLWHMSACGDALDSLPRFGEDELPPGWPPIPRRFGASGEVIVGPIDGGTHDLAWHRVLIDADMPAGCTITVQTFADNKAEPSSKPWAPRIPVAMPRAAADRPGAELDRLVLAEQELWPLWRLGRLTRATPVIHQFEAGAPGPVDSAALNLPAEAANRLFVGERIRLQTVDKEAEFEIVGAGPRAVTIAASGSSAAFAAPQSLSLIESDRGATGTGATDLSFLANPATVSLAGLTRDGRPESALLPHGLAAFLQVGDVVELGSGARFEVIEPADDTVTFLLNTATEGDYSLAEVRLLKTAGRLVVEEDLPGASLAPGATVTVIDDLKAEQHGVRRVDAPRRTIWLEGAGLGKDDPTVETQIQITEGSWTNAQFAEPRATDKGRYLWVRLRLTGAGLPPPDRVGPSTLATATPAIRSLRVTGPRPTLLAWLPALFSRRDAMEEPPGANFLERFLALFEGQLTRMETAFESVSRLINPRAADAEWLDFVASWLELSFDPIWPIERRRQLVIEGAALQAGRGTPAALIRYLEIFTGAPAAITESFRARPPLPITLGSNGALGVAPLGGGSVDAPNRFAHRFTVAVQLPEGVDRDDARKAVRKIIESMKPAHTLYVLDTGSRRLARIGIDTAVDSIIIPGPLRDEPCACDPEAKSGPRPQPGHVDGGFRLGGRLGSGGVAEVSFNGG